MMKKVIAALLLLAGTMFGTTVTGTITDPNAQAYVSGTVMAQLTPAAGRPNLNDYTVNGTPFAQNVTGTLDTLGAFSITLTDNTTVSPAGSQWKFTLCSKTTAPCTVTNPITISGGAQNVGATINAQVVAIKLFAFNQPNYVGSAYSDVEIINPTYGTVYWNTLSNAMRVYNGSSWANIGSISSSSRPGVNFITDCGGPSDRVSDSYAAWLVCYATYPGHHIYFPKLAAATKDGFSGTNQDYYFSNTLVIDDNGTWLDGETPANGAGGVYFQFAAGVAGIRCSENANSCHLSNLMLRGTNTYNPSDRTTYPDWRGTEAALLRGNGVDGIQLLALGARLENILVEGFARHGIYIAGDNIIHASSFPDFWFFDRVTLNSNGGNGIYANGGDSNAGVGIMIDSRVNGLYGVQDNASLGNTWIGVGTHANHNDQLTAGTTQALTSCTVGASNDISCITAGALANGIDTLNTWVTTAGQVDASFNGTFRVTSFNAGTRTVSGTFTHAAGGTTGGTVGLASTANVYNAWSAAGINGGCIGGSGQNATWIQPYIESGQGIGGICVRLTQYDTIYGSNNGEDQVSDLTNSQPTWIKPGRMWVGEGTNFNNPRDSHIILQLQAGVTADQFEEIHFLNHLGVSRQQLTWSPSDVLGFQDDVDGFSWLDKVSGGDLDLRGTSATEDVNLQKAIGRDVVGWCGGLGVCFRIQKSDGNTYGNSYLPLAAGTKNIGSAPLPIGHIFLGGAANTSVDVSCGACTANRTDTIADVSGAIEVRLTASDNTVDLASVNTALCTAERTVAVTGAAFGDAVNIMAGTALEAGTFLTGKVSSAGNIKWQFCNLSGVAVDRASDSYTIKVIK